MYPDVSLISDTIAWRVDWAYYGAFNYTAMDIDVTQAIIILPSKWKVYTNAGSIQVALFIARHEVDDANGLKVSRYENMSNIFGSPVIQNLSACC